MIDRIGKESALVREAMRAAQKFAGEGLAARPAEGAGQAERLQPASPERMRGIAPPSGEIDFAQALRDGVQAVDQRVQAADAMPADLITGRIDDFHEIAVQLKSAELSFRFAMEIRNKLVDAYREIMRMSV